MEGDMSLDTAIELGKEKRKPYRRAKSVDTTCRNHGDCPWCKGTRTNKNREKKRVAEEFIREYNALVDAYLDMMEEEDDG
jgi:hypothetical protein